MAHIYWTSTPFEPGLTAAFTQIWFQNRRQMTRRKSRPLLPHEIFSFHSSQELPDNANTSSFTAQSNSQQQRPSSQSSIMESQSTVKNFDANPLGETSAEATISHATIETAPTISSNAVCQDLLNSGPGPTPVANTSALEQKVDGGQRRIADLIRSLSQTAPIKRRPDYLANRRSASFIIHDEEHRGTGQLSGTQVVEQTAQEAYVATSSQPLRRTLPNVRLSLSLDGEAKVTTDTGTTPSPPRSQPVPLINSAPRSHVGLQRSYSAVEPTNKSAHTTISAPYPRRPAGRSRDARTWEFYCDSDARNALTEQAEMVESGSATAAISLIRSHSNKSKAMTPNVNKRNAQTQKPDSTKRLKADSSKTSKPKLGRAVSSVARLQTINGNTQKQKPGKDGHKHSKSNSQSTIYQDYDGDSDKENWEPGTQTSNPPGRRPVKSRQAARILEESLRIPSQSSSLDALMSRESNTPRRKSRTGPSSEGKENKGLEVDDEVATFMCESGPREVEDLDCVQNLLSLSQAAWH